MQDQMRHPLTIVAVQLHSMHPPAHGSARLMRRLMEQLAAAGHKCTLLTLYRHVQGPACIQTLDALEAAGIEPSVSAQGSLVYADSGVDYSGVLYDSQRFPAFMEQRLQSLKPDLVLISDEMDALTIAALGRALARPRVRTYYLVNTLFHLPAGPFAFQHNPLHVEMIRHADGVIVPGQHAREYINANLALDAQVLYPDIADTSGWHGAGIGGYVTLVNPCEWKGLSLFLQLAQAMPHVRFLAVLGWGSGREEIRAMQRHANIAIVSWQPNFGRVIARTAILLVPSAFPETFGMVATEALAAGVPVIASDQGGLVEAMLDVPHLLPVAAVKPEGGKFIRQQQDATPWIETLAKLLDSPHDYELISQQSRLAAQQFIRDKQWTPTRLNAWLSSLLDD